MRNGIRLTILFGAFSATLALVLAGCGGGDDSSEPVTKQQFVRQANTICAEWQKERSERAYAALEEAPGKKPTRAEEKEELFEILAIFEETNDGVEELDPPAGEEQKVEAITKAFDESIAERKAHPYEERFGKRDYFNKPNKLAEDYGLKECFI